MSEPKPVPESWETEELGETTEPNEWPVWQQEEWHRPTEVEWLVPEGPTGDMTRPWWQTDLRTACGR